MLNMNDITMDYLGAIERIKETITVDTLLALPVVVGTASFVTYRILSNSEEICFGISFVPHTHEEDDAEAQVHNEKKKK